MSNNEEEERKLKLNRAKAHLKKAQEKKKKSNSNTSSSNNNSHSRTDSRDVSSLFNTYVYLLLYLAYLLKFNVVYLLEHQLMNLIHLYFHQV